MLIYKYRLLKTICTSIGVQIYRSIFEVSFHLEWLYNTHNVNKSKFMQISYKQDIKLTL